MEEYIESTMVDFQRGLIVLQLKLPDTNILDGELNS